MARRSAGLLMHRITDNKVEVLLVHPGGPFWEKKDMGAWTIPKGEYQEDQDALTAARREFEEETGCRADGVFRHLGTVKQKGGKIVTAWAFEGDLDPLFIKSNTFPLEWPPGSGRKTHFPEIDRARWFTLDRARAKIIESQRVFLDNLTAMLDDHL